MWKYFFRLSIGTRLWSRITHAIFVTVFRCPTEQCVAKLQVSYTEYLLLMITLCRLDQRKPATNHRDGAWTPSVKSCWAQANSCYQQRPLRKTWLETEYCLICKWASIFPACHYLMSLSRKLYFPKSLSFGAIRWSFLALASFIKRNSLRSIHSFSSCSPWASLHESSSVHVPFRNLLKHNIKHQKLEERPGTRNRPGV